MGKLVFNKKEIFLKMIENSTETKMFQSCFFKDSNSGVSVDVCEGGRLSCAFFVSGILKMIDLIKAMHVTVDSLEKEMLNSGWKERASVSNLDLGNVVFWKDRITSKNEHHRHVGFYIGDGNYIDNDDEPLNMSPKKHHNNREIEKVYYHPLLS